MDAFLVVGFPHEICPVVGKVILPLNALPVAVWFLTSLSPPPDHNFLLMMMGITRDLSL